MPPLPPSLLGSGAPLAAALGELVAGAGEEEADMGRLQVILVLKKYESNQKFQAMLEARGFPPHLAGVLGPRMHHLILNR